MFKVRCCIVCYIMLFGCNDGVRINSPEDSAPIFQQSPSWSGEGLLYFYNAGIVDYSNNGSRIDESYQGITRYDIVRNKYDIVLQNGVTPNVCTNSDIVVCQYENNGGPLYLIDHGAAASIIENEMWGWRVNPSISSDGILLAWESRDLDHDAGIWIHNTHEQTYTYVGVGAYPIWKPDTNILLYRCINNNNVAELIEYNYSTNISNSVYALPPGSRYLCGAYSPDGTCIVYCSVSANEPKYAIYISDIIANNTTLINNHSAKGITWGNGGIVYGNGCRDINNDGCGVLWIIDPKSFEYHQLTSRLQFVVNEKSDR